MPVSQSAPSAKIRPFGFTADGKPVGKIILDNGNGMRVDLLEYGATLHRVRTPDASGHCEDIVLYCESPVDYQKQTAYLGGTIGRYANRIADSRFSLNGKAFALSCNETPNHLHGGHRGFHTRLWESETYSTESSIGALFKLHSPSLDQGYPGAMDVIVDYCLTQDNRLRITFSASSDESTIVSLTNHAYFNLSGDLFSNLKGHTVKIFSDQITRSTNNITDGTIDKVNGTVLDFTNARSVAEILNNLPAELQELQGFDHNFIFENDMELHRMARITHQLSGRILSISSDYPAAQFYTANYLKNCNARGPSGRLYGQHNALCVEPQQYPNAPNIPHFPSPVIHPGQTSRHIIEYLFETAIDCG